MCRGSKWLLLVEAAQCVFENCPYRMMSLPSLSPFRGGAMASGPPRHTHSLSVLIAVICSNSAGKGDKE